MPINKRTLLKMAILAPAMGNSFAADQPTPVWQVNSIKEVYDDLNALKEGVPFAAKWWEFKFQWKNFVICSQDFPSFGQSRQSIHIWNQSTSEKAAPFKLAWSFRIVGIGPVEIVVNEHEGTVAVTGLANPSLKGKKIAFVTLAAT